MEDKINFEGLVQYATDLFGIEAEHEPDDNIIEDLDIPYNPSEIRIDQKMLSLYQINRWISKGMLELQPEFQRNFIWNKRKQSLLIESLMLGIPIPAFYFDENAEGERTVIDGLQRLTTIRNYLNGDFKLVGLQYLRECEGEYFEGLNIKYQTRIEDTQLAVNILDARCPYRVKLDVFRRINTGGVPLNPQEIRNIMATKQTRLFLNELAKNHYFLQATHNKIKDIRMDAQELCLRFIAYERLYNFETKEFENFGNMINILDSSIDFLNNCSLSELDIIEEKFETSMKRCYATFGDRTFCRDERKIVNRALFISFSIIMSYMSCDENILCKNQKRAISLLDQKLKDNKYYSAITSSTSSRNNMRLQFECACEILEELMK